MRDDIPVLLLDEARTAGRPDRPRPPDGRPPWRAARRGSTATGSPTSRCSTTRRRCSRNDPGGMLRATASAGAQVRESAALAAEADLSMLADEGRPRAVVVAGIGTAGLTGNILATVAGHALPGADHRAPQRRHPRLGRRGRRGHRRLRLRPQPGGAGRRRRRRPPRGPAGRDRQPRLRVAGDGRAGPRAVHPGAPPRPGPGQPVGPDRPGAARGPRARPGQGQRGRLRRDRHPAGRRRRALPPRRRVVRQPGQGRWRSAWPARSRSSGVRPRWPPSPPAASPTRWPPTRATR